MSNERGRRSSMNTISFFACLNTKRLLTPSYGFENLHHLLPLRAPIALCFMLHSFIFIISADPIHYPSFRRERKAWCMQCLKSLFTGAAWNGRFQEETTSHWHPFLYTSLKTSTSLVIRTFWSKCLILCWVSEETSSRLLCLAAFLTC